MPITSLRDQSQLPSRTEGARSNRPTHYDLRGQSATRCRPRNMVDRERSASNRPNAERTRLARKRGFLDTITTTVPATASSLPD